MASTIDNTYIGFSRESTPGHQEDILARKSDVIVSTNITSFAEYKGFFIYVLSGLALSCWFVWGFVPSWVLQDYLGASFFPNKYWSLAIPSYSLILMLYVYIGLALYNTEYKTLDLADVRNFADEYQVSAGELDPTKSYVENIEFEAWKSSSGVCDLPITFVNEVLYGQEELIH